MKDNIELVLPFKADYVSVARLASSGIAARVGFDFEVVEDIKVAIAEVCNKLVTVGSKTAESFRLVFSIGSESLTVAFYCDDSSLKDLFGDEGDELGLSIINALMDEVDFAPGSDYLLSMTKALEG